MAGKTVYKVFKVMEDDTELLMKDRLILEVEEEEETLEIIVKKLVGIGALPKGAKASSYIRSGNGGSTLWIHKRLKSGPSPYGNYEVILIPE